MVMNPETRSGKPVFPIGIGTWGFGGTWEPEYGKEKEAVDYIRYSLSKGQNHIDGAQVYGGGHTDEVIGQAIDGLNREDLFITDKVWETNVATGTVRPAVEEMLKKLGTDYLDGLYIHKPWDDFPWREAIPQINQLMSEGIVLRFGVSNFNLDQVKETIELSQHPVSLSQLHYNILKKQNVEVETLTFYKEHGIQLVAYKPLERGKVLENEIVQSIAKAHNATPTQIALAWLLAQDALPIPQSPSLRFIDENIAASDLKLSPEEIDQLDKL